MVQRIIRKGKIKMLQRHVFLSSLRSIIETHIIQVELKEMKAEKRKMMSTLTVDKELDVKPSDHQ